MTFKNHGKLITVHGRKIAVNALKDEDEARKGVFRHSAPQWIEATRDAPGLDPRPQAEKINTISTYIVSVGTGCKTSGLRTANERN